MVWIFPSEYPLENFHGGKLKITPIETENPLKTIHLHDFGINNR